MSTGFEFDSLKVSWTKYDIVHALDVFESIDTMESYFRGEAPFDGPVLRAVLCVRAQDKSIPEFWYDVIRELDGKEKTFFLFFAFLFTNSRILTTFSEYMKGPFKGEYCLEGGKESTNLRSLLVESGLSSAAYRRKEVVPFDGSMLLNSPKAGMLFKKYLERLIRIHSHTYNENDFYEICYKNHFGSLLGFTRDRFRTWLEGGGLNPQMCEKIQFENFLCFDGETILDFCGSKEIYIVGENGDGKSLLLWLIFLAFNGYQLNKRYDAKYIGQAISNLNKCVNCKLQGRDDLDQVYTVESSPVFKNFYAYGPHRGLYASGSDEQIEHHGFMTLFDNNLKLRDPIAWLKDLYFKQQNCVSCLENSFDNVTKVVSELLDNKVEIKIHDNDLSFYEKEYPLGLDNLSEGHRGIIIMACDLLSRLMENNGYSKNVFDVPGVVIIDEICQHLHPTWQQKIVGRLREIFKNIQFIFTTHSPFVIQGASEDALAYRVFRDGGRAYVSDLYKVSDMNGMMINTLVTSSLFDLDSAAVGLGTQDLDTSDSDIISRINNAVRLRIDDLKVKGHKFLSPKNIDSIVQDLLGEELEDDKNI